MDVHQIKYYSHNVKIQEELFSQDNVLFVQTVLFFNLEAANHDVEIFKYGK